MLVWTDPQLLVTDARLNLVERRQRLGRAGVLITDRLASN